jgi:hypothetical protein
LTAPGALAFINVDYFSFHFLSHQFFRKRTHFDFLRFLCGGAIVPGKKPALIPSAFYLLFIPVFFPGSPTRRRNVFAGQRSLSRSGNVGPLIWHSPDSAEIDE